MIDQRSCYCAMLLDMDSQATPCNVCMDEENARNETFELDLEFWWNEESTDGEFMTLVEISAFVKKYRAEARPSVLRGHEKKRAAKVST